MKRGRIARWPSAAFRKAARPVPDRSLVRSEVELEDRRRYGENEAVGVGPRGGAARLALHEGHLAENLARLDDGQPDLVAGLRPIDTDAAALHEIGLFAAVPDGEHLLAGGEHAAITANEALRVAEEQALRSGHGRRAEIPLVAREEQGVEVLLDVRELREEEEEGEEKVHVRQEHDEVAEDAVQEVVAGPAHEEMKEAREAESPQHAERGCRECRPARGPLSGGANR